MKKTLILFVLISGSAYSQKTVASSPTPKENPKTKRFRLSRLTKTTLLIIDPAEKNPYNKVVQDRNNKIFEKVEMEVFLG